MHAKNIQINDDIEHIHEYSLTTESGRRLTFFPRRPLSPFKPLVPGKPGRPISPFYD